MAAGDKTEWTELGRGPSGALLAAGAIVLAGTLVAIWTYQLLASAERDRQQSVLAIDAEQATGVIRSHFARHETQVMAAQALFAGSELVSRDEWRAFAEAFQHPDDRYSLFELVWIARVTPDELGQLQASSEMGSPQEWSVYPPDEREYYCPIVYNEPIERHAASLGFDVCLRPNSREALQLSRETGEHRLSEPLLLSWDTEEMVDGYVLYAWVEGTEQQPPGWVAGTFTTQSVFEIPTLNPERIQLRVFDESARDGRQQVYVHGEPGQDSNRMLVVERDLAIGGRHLTLAFSTPTRPGIAPWLVLFACMAIALLLSVLVHTLMRTRAYALATARRMSRAYRESEELLSSVTNNIQEGIYRGVPDKGLVYVNQSLADMFGFQTPEEMMAHSRQSLYADQEQRRKLQELLAEKGHYRNQEVEFLRRDGSRFIAMNNAIATHDEHGNITHFDGVVLDITERKQAEEQIHRLAHYDPLTGLPNRSLLNDRVDQALHEAGRAEQPLTVMFMDLDRFKTINDSLGHGIGDRLLIAVARRLKKQVRDDDTVSRLGGDEFVLVLPGMAAAVAADKARQILVAFRKPFDVDGHELVVTPSIGISVFPEDGSDSDTLIRNADAAMYKAKEQGRSTFCYFTTELNETAYERLTVETRLRNALDQGELSLVYQPVIDLSDGRIVGAEALLRWHNPQLGDVPPSRFIPIAEQSGLIVEIGDWVIDQACRQLCEWQEQGATGISIAVNVSAIQFWRGNLDKVIKQALQRCQIKPEQLEVELTESVIMEDADAASRVLGELKKLGIRLVIDDFGTGYSSLSYLKRFKIDRLKIDRSFVRDVATDADDAAIISAIASMAHDLRFHIVAEGVETEEQLKLVRERDCDFAQGFLFSRPIPPDELLTLLESGDFVVAHQGQSN